MAFGSNLKSIWAGLVRSEGEGAPNRVDSALVADKSEIIDPVWISPEDPIAEQLVGAQGPVDITGLDLASPALQAMRDAAVHTVVPLVSQGELIGTLNLGPRLSHQEYSTDDLKLLNNLATQAAPAVRVAQLVRQQQAEAQQRERIEHEQQIAKIIQQTLLPKELPSVPGWQVAAYYQPAREVGGDFYDFIELPDQRLGFVVGDVTDKGVPAALVMATTRAIMRAAAEQLISPGEVLQRANEILCPDIPPNMFVTCLYAVLDPIGGRMQYANAGHDLPYHRRGSGCDELRATGMPLGLMPGMKYEEKQVDLSSGESVLFYSDGLVEAHNPDREMFGFPRLMKLVEGHPGGGSLINHLLSELSVFTGHGWEQEDDVTMVTLQRVGQEQGEAFKMTVSGSEGKPANDPMRTLARFDVASEPGNERAATAKVEAAVSDLFEEPARLEKLKTAVAEAVMNAMEHGNKYDADLPVEVQVAASDRTMSVYITDHGGDREIPDPAIPDIEAKLAGEQSPRGWGLFLIKNLVDDMKVTVDEAHHTLELVMDFEGGDHGDATP